MRSIVFLVLLAACGGQRPLEIYADEQMLPIVTALVEAANVDVDPPLFRIVEPGTVGAVGVLFSADVTCGLFNPYLNTIEISDCGYRSKNTRAQTSVKTAILAHELGHALGLSHSDDTKSIMYYQVTKLWEMFYLVESLHAELHVGRFGTKILPPNAP